ncbi:MAG: glucuronate isomerase [Bacteroidota bacterium]
MIKNEAELRRVVQRAVLETPVTDIHTHLFTPDFGGQLLWGIDELITYHYLVAETFRYVKMPYADFWRMTKRAQADLIWRTLFLEHSPVSESCRGVLTVLQALGLDTRARDLEGYRAYFAGQTVDKYLDRVLATANVDRLVMTNDPFVPDEHRVWMAGVKGDPRFYAALRIDPLLNNWESACRALQAWGYQVEPGLSPGTQAEVRRFIKDWIARMKPVYLAASLPPDFSWPEESARALLLEQCLLPAAAEHGLPMAMMIGVKKLVNKGLALAGDSVGKSAIEPVENLCAAFPDNKFMLTMLARENQHECCVAARKFGNLLLFGCWWFMNNPSLIDETTRMRLELLGLSFVPQHSDARVLDQLIYKWSHSRAVMADALVDKYVDLYRTGWLPTEEEIKRDVAGILGENFWTFLK